MGGRRHVGDLLQQFDVFGVLAEFVIAHQRAEGRSAEDAVLFLVDFLEQRALIEFRRALQILQQFLLADFRTLIFSMVPVSLWSIRYLMPRQVPSSFWNEGWCMTSFNCSETR